MARSANVAALSTRGRAVLAALVVLALAACERDDEAALRADLDQWFFLGDTLYFESRMRCTAAMLHVNIDRTRPGVAVQDHPARAMEAFRTSRFAAIRVPGVTPEALTDAMLLTEAGTFGKEALAAGSLAGPCVDGSRTGAFLHDAMIRPGATLAYDRETQGLMILDPARNMLFYIAGDVW